MKPEDFTLPSRKCLESAKNVKRIQKAGYRSRSDKTYVDTFFSIFPYSNMCLHEGLAGSVTPSIKGEDRAYIIRVRAPTSHFLAFDRDTVINHLTYHSFHVNARFFLLLLLSLLPLARIEPYVYNEAQLLHMLICTVPHTIDVLYTLAAE